VTIFPRNPVGGAGVAAEEVLEVEGFDLSASERIALDASSHFSLKEASEGDSLLAAL
jgi:hypothetical protein